jgi:hypothetical protein
MTTLSSFTPEDQDILITTPYAIGVWMAHKADSAGENDDAREAASLKVIMGQLTRQHVGNELVHDVFQTLHNHIDTHDLIVDTDTALDQVVAAVRTIIAVANPTEAKSYASAMLDIATAVARAANEQDDIGERSEDEQDGWWGKVTAKAGAVWSQVASTLNADLNISPDEDSALTELSETLKRALNVKPR